MGLKVTAEGVESQEGMALLAEYGCDTAQGYGISRPLPASQLQEWFEAQSTVKK